MQWPGYEYSKVLNLFNINMFLIILNIIFHAQLEYSLPLIYHFLYNAKLQGKILCNLDYYLTVLLISLLYKNLLLTLKYTLTYTQTITHTTNLHTHTLFQKNTRTYTKADALPYAYLHIKKTYILVFTAMKYNQSVLLHIKI